MVRGTAVELLTVIYNNFMPECFSIPFEKHSGFLLRVMRNPVEFKVPMKNYLNTDSGFTLVEVLVSLAILLLFLPAVASMLTGSQLLASLSKHKTEAAYVAQQLIETERQNINAFFTAPIGPLTAGQSYVIGPSTVVLDTKGNYSSSTNYFNGVSVITVTPSVYTNASGVQTTSTTTDHFVVTIYWTEQITKAKVQMNETYAADIINDPMLN